MSPEVALVSFFSVFVAGLLLRSHSLKQFACLSKSVKRGLSLLTPVETPLCIQINGCFHSYQEPTPSLPIPPSSSAFCYHLDTSVPVNISTSIRVKTDCGFEKKKPGPLFNEIEKC